MISEPSPASERGDDKEKKEFNLDNFLKRQLSPRWTAGERTLPYSKDELLTLVDRVIEQLKGEKPLARLKAPCCIVGDIHGQYSDLLRIFEKIRDTYGLKKNTRHGAVSMRYMFLGDYVDRGRRSLECITLLFALKLKFPKQYKLLRGNHECKQINRVYGFWQEIADRFKNKEVAEEIYKKYNDAFAYLPLLGIVQDKILCMHGGISPKLQSLDDVEKYPRPLDDPSKYELAMDLLWADPKEQSEPFSKNLIRGVSVFFNEAAVTECCSKLGLDMVVRAHQMMVNGYGFFADRKCVTVFTAPRYQSDLENKGAVMVVGKDGKIHFSLFNANREEGTFDDTPTVFPT